MEMPTEGTAAAAYLTRSAYSISRVAADPKAKGLEKGLAAVHSELKTRLRELEDAEEEAEKKSAVLDSADEACDDDIAAFELHLLGAVKKDRENPRYQRYFKNGLRDVTQADARTEEPQIVAGMLEDMAKDKSDPDIGEAVTHWLPRLTTSRAAVLSADSDLSLVEKQIASLKEKIIPALMATWREEYKKLEGALLTVYPTDTKKVSRFFKPFRKRGKLAKPEANAPTAPAPTTP